MKGVASELAVAERPVLERSERHHPLVRLPEEAEPEEADPDHEQGRPDEGDEQLDVDPGRQTGNRPHERIVRRAQQSALRLPRCSLRLRHVTFRPALR